jgi:hypothetical protein
MSREMWRPTTGPGAPWPPEGKAAALHERSTPGLEVYHGQSGVREWMVDIFEVFRSSRVEVDEITDLSGGRVFTEPVLIASGRSSGVPQELRFWQVLQWAEGKCARRQVFWDRDEALEAAGLSE